MLLEARRVNKRKNNEPPVFNPFFESNKKNSLRLLGTLNQSPQLTPVRSVGRREVGVRGGAGRSGAGSGR